MKKIKSILTLLLCVFTFCNVSAKTIKLKECEYTDEYIKWLELSDEDREKTIMPTMCKNIKNNNYSMLGNSISGVSINDSKFDLRNYNMVTSVKDQGKTGACWTFSTNAAIESNLLMNNVGEYDLSEAHLELSTQNTYDYGRSTFSRKANTGGSADWTSLAYFMNGWGPVEESYLPFQKLVNLYDNKETIDSKLITDNKAIFDINKVALLGNGENMCTSDNIENVKEYLISEGALTGAIYLDPYSSRKEYYYYDGAEYTDSEGNLVSANKGVNHAVTIIGWDDTISKNNFGTSATRDGAFILKNSYGTKINEGELELFKNYLYSSNTEAYNGQGITDASQVPNSDVINFIVDFYNINKEQVIIENGNVYTEIGMDGYHYISYDDVHICNILTGFIDIDKNIEDNNYGYTNLGTNAAYGSESLDTLYSMSKYTKKSNENEILKEVVIVFNQPGIDYTIYFADKDTDNITDAEVVAEGTSTIKGMETIEVTNKKITSNKFTIFVKLEKENGIWFSVVLKPTFTYNNPFGSFEATSEVEYISQDAINYSDVSDAKFNLSLKVNTNLESTNGDDIDIPVNPPADDKEDDNDTSVNPPADDKEDDNDTSITPPVDDKEDDNDTSVNPPVDDKEQDDEDYPEVDEDKINTDGKIEIEENEYNKENNDDKQSSVNENADQTIDNPKTGLYIPMLLIILIGVSIIVIRKNIKNKVFKI